MSPIQIERKDGWAVGIKPQDKIITLDPGEQVELYPSHDVSLDIICNGDDGAGSVHIISRALEIEGGAHSEDRYPSTTAVILEDQPIKIKGSQGQELAEIKHIPQAKKAK